MAYLGQAPFQEFTNPPTKDSFTGDGSTTTFDMNATVPSSAQNALEVYVDNVRQEPGAGKAFTLGPDGSNDMKRITFSAAPANGASIYVINDKTNTSVTAPLQNDLNGTELILDGDGDTSITADADDRIDFKIAAADHFHITTSSGDTVFQNKTDAKDFLFNQYDGRTILEINDAGYVALSNGATGSGELRIYEDTDNGTNYTSFKVGTQSANIEYTLPTADGSSGQALVTNGSGVLSFVTPGAITSYTNSTNNRIVTSVDSSTVNSEANLTFDGSALQVTGTLTVGADDTGHDVIFYGATASANMTWDESVDDLILNGAARIVIPDGQLVLGSTAVTSTAAELNLLDGVSGLVQADFTKLAAVDSTAAELNIMDGNTTASDIAVHDDDRVVYNDNGTMKQVAMTNLAAYFDDEITAMPNLVRTGALDQGSITSGFGNIDNGTSNITSGGLVKLDVDADADDVSGDSATGRLTIGAGEDLNFYHGGTNSYIVNDTGDLIIKTGASDEDFIIKGNDGGSEVTALTLDMSAGGAAAFNSTVTATGFIIGSANINETELEILDGATITTTELNLIDGGATVGTTAVADGDGILHNDDGTMKVTSAATFKTYFQEGISQAYDDFTVGDAAVNVTTTAGDITIDAQGNDTDIIFKGTDGGSDTTFLTIDGSAAGAAAFNGVVTANAGVVVDNITIDGTEIDLSSGDLTLDVAGDINLDADGGTINLNDAGTNVGKIILSSNGGDLIISSRVQDKDFVVTGNDGGTPTEFFRIDSSEAGAATFANKVIATELDISGNVDVDGTLETDALSIDGTAVTTTAAEINLIDGGTARGTTAVADADGLLHNDGGTMRMTSAATFKTYFQEGAGFASGTDMIFFQAAAPTGWTKSTANNNKYLRVVSGDGGGTGGTAAVTSPAHNLSAGAHTLSTSELASHSHQLSDIGHNAVNPGPFSPGGTAIVRMGFTRLNPSGGSTLNTANTGSGSSHSHNLSGSITTPQYIDVIVAAKD